MNHAQAVRLFLLACISAVAGCTHHPALGDIRSLAGASVRVETVDGGDEDGEVVATPGGVLIRTERGDFELVDVVQLTERKRLRGMLEGMGLGLLVGGVLGAGLGYASGSDKPSLSTFTRGDNAVVFGVLYGAVGLLVGLVVGAVRGSRDVYRDVYTIGGTARPPTRIIPVGPAGSAVGATIQF